MPDSGTELGPGVDRLSGEPRTRIKPTKPVFVEPVPVNPVRDACRVGMHYRDQPTHQTRDTLLETRKREGISLLHRNGMRQVSCPPLPGLRRAAITS